jgi:hypothetical protein
LSASNRALPHRTTPALWSAGLTTLALLILSGRAWAQDDAGWTFKFTPYFMFSGLDGDVGVRGRTAAVDASFSDLADHLNFGLLGAFEARRGRLGLLTDVIYLDLGADGDFPRPDSPLDRFEVDASNFVLSPAVGYRVTRPGPISVDVGAGIRYWNVSNTLTLTGEAGGGLELDDSQDWIDPILGTRLRADFNDHWFGLALGDIGGFGAGSDFTWQAFGAIGYSFDSRGHYSLLAGWRQLDVDYENEDEGFLWDVGMGGPTIGITFAW